MLQKRWIFYTKKLQGDYAPHVYILTTIFIPIFYLLFWNKPYVNKSFYLVYFLWFLHFCPNVKKILFELIRDKKLLLILAISILLRTQLSIFSFAHINYHGIEYLDQIVSGNLLQEEVPYGFTYTLFWSIFSGLFDEAIYPFFYANLFLNSLCGVLMFFIARKVFKNKSFAYLAFLIFSLLPTQIRYSATESHFTLVLFLQCYLFFLIYNQDDKIDLHSFFYTLALLTFARPEMFPVIIPFSILFVIKYYSVPSNRKLLLNFSLYLAFFFLLILPPMIPPIQKTFYYFLYHSFPAGDLSLSIKILLETLIRSFTNMIAASPIFILSSFGLFSAVFIKRFRMFALWSSAYIIFYCSILPNVHAKAPISTFYTSHLEAILTIGACIFISILHQNLKSLPRNHMTKIMLIFWLLPIVQLIVRSPYISKLYDEQIEFQFLRKNLHIIAGHELRILTLNWDRDRELYLTFPQSFRDYHRQSGPTIISFGHSIEHLSKEHNIIVFRSLLSSDQKHNKKFTQAGLKPLLIKNFRYERRYDSLSERSLRTIGFYRYD